MCSVLHMNAQADGGRDWLHTGRFLIDSQLPALERARRHAALRINFAPTVAAFSRVGPLLVCGMSTVCSGMIFMLALTAYGSITRALMAGLLSLASGIAGGFGLPKLRATRARRIVVRFHGKYVDLEAKPVEATGRAAENGN